MGQEKKRGLAGAYGLFYTGGEGVKCVSKGHCFFLCQVQNLAAQTRFSVIGMRLFFFYAIRLMVRHAYCEMLPRLCGLPVILVILCIFRSAQKAAISCVFSFVLAFFFSHHPGRDLLESAMRRGPGR